MGTAKPRVTEQ